MTPHGQKAAILFQQGRYGPAVDALRQQLSAEPDDPWSHAMMALSLLLAGKGNKPAEDAALRAIALEPAYPFAWHALAIVQNTAGKPALALESIRECLRLDPQDAEAHAARGWALLHAARAGEAEHHFREALRLDPAKDYAKEGFVRSLKARHPVYRVILRYLLWMSRQRTVVRFGVVGTLLVGRKVIEAALKEAPQLAWVLVPVAVVFVLLLLTTWAADPVFNLMVRRDPEGRHLLSPRQRAATNYLITLALIVVLSTAVLISARDFGTASYATLPCLLALPLSVALSYPRGSARRKLLWVTGCCAGAGAICVALLALNTGRNNDLSALATLAGVLYGLGCLLSLRFADAVGDDPPP
jgi:tetratricopeptide (TPR) repeat protein